MQNIRLKYYKLGHNIKSFSLLDLKAFSGLYLQKLLQGEAINLVRELHQFLSSK